ncbi:ACP S-malonyltransferase [Alicyclobacillus sp. TC]|uniref:Malonyl CoA-acyl carrier protein transacylase n=1 Tax=Alicyclobacillus tolerans TaxID=90970 RepID=A0A1M6QAS8_9BACL|nr:MULTISPECIES: ACP S-malonyltransferase [Alicyclobacillus]QRF23758.1 ACP S-malonyltransferase [Alicyclobacillus sp. TC]SHK17240.1 [acyl-carrier-protein] S-malonyltransferase [Alicyclobacillus montanus]
MTVGFVFPGQGAQTVGMGKSLIENYPLARQTFIEADEALGFSLTKLCLEGPEEELRLTYHAQPALLTAGVAAWRVFQSQSSIRPVAVAGHSLGEYTALVAANMLPFADAVKLVYHRGQLMNEAVPAGQGAMSAVMGLEEEELAAICAEASNGSDVVELANLNCPGQIVISGTQKAVSNASELAKQHKARRVIPLVVSGPFHSSLMRPAAAAFDSLLQEAPFRDGDVPVIANVDAEPYQTPDAARKALSRQLYSPVRFVDDIHTMVNLGVQTFVEFGVGSVLSGLIKKIDKNVRTLRVEDEPSLHETLQALTE